MSEATASAVSRMTAVVEALDSAASKKRMTALGVELKPVGLATVSLGGDRAFSGWRRRAPIQLEVAFALHGDGQGVTMHRAGKSAGPWRVANDGRNRGGGGGGFQGPGVNRSTGATKRTKSGGVAKVRASKGRRWNGTTRPKSTWDKASAAMAHRAPQVIVESTRRDVLAAFTGGG